MLKILIADDHRVLREGLKKIIESARDMEVISEASDGAEALAKAVKTRPDVILLDISMPGASGIDVLKQIKTRSPKAAVLMLSQHPENQYAMRALRAGASGYLTKESAADDLILAIRKVASGGKFVSPALAEQLADSLDEEENPVAHERLSDREYEVLRFLGSGKTVTEIAEDLSLSVKTISTYRTRILEKMKLSKTNDIILYVIQHQLLPDKGNAHL